jgi:dimethylglycine dehydrogenase
MSCATTDIHKYSVDFYTTLEEEVWRNAAAGFAVVGNLRMAQIDARMDDYMRCASTGGICGVHCDRLSPAQIKALAAAAHRRSEGASLVGGYPGTSGRMLSE